MKKEARKTSKTAAKKDVKKKLTKRGASVH